MSKNKKYSYEYILKILSNFILLQITMNQELPFYDFPLELFGPNNLPILPIYFKNYISTPILMLLDINLDKSWIFQNNGNEKNDNYNEIIDYKFFVLKGNRNKEIICLKDNIMIEDFSYINICQINGDNYYYPGALPLNKKINEYSFANKLKYEDDTINNQYFGFALDFINERKLSIGNMHTLNNNISNLTRLPLYQDDENEKYEKWAIILNGIFIGSVNKSLTEKNIIGNERKIIYNINKKYNKGLIIDEVAYIETIYNSIYVPKEAMLFLIANYFNGKENICIRQDIKDEDNYEIKFNCFKNKKSSLKIISLNLENNITLQLAPDNLLNCAINQNIIDKNGKKEMCEFNIKYNKKIDNYVLGLSVFKQFKSYFLFNNNSIYLEGNNEFLNCYLNKGKFSNISRNKKRNLFQTIKELFNTTLCISLIFALLAGSFYLYDKYYGKVEYLEEEEAEKIINRDKYANL